MRILRFDDALCEEKCVTKTRAAHTTAKQMHKYHCWIFRLRFATRNSNSSLSHGYTHAKCILLSPRSFRPVSRLSVTINVSMNGDASLSPLPPFKCRFVVCMSVYLFIWVCLTYLRCVSDILAHMLLPRGVDFSVHFEPSVQTVLPDFKRWLIVEGTS